METKATQFIEDVSDMFDQNIDPRVLRDRMTQVARTRELALDAAKAAEQAGNADLASKLRADAEELQQILDLTRQNANIHRPTSDLDDNTAPETASDATEGDKDADTIDDEDENETNTDPTENESDEDDFEEDDDDDMKNAPDDSNGATDEEAPVSDTEEEDDSQFNDEESNAQDTSDNNSDSAEDEASANDADENNADSDADKSNSDTNSASNSSEASDDNNASSSSSSNDAGEEDSDSAEEDDDDESDAYGIPKVKDDTVLQDPFKNDQIEVPLPKDMEAAIKNGTLKIEPEIEAIIRILSKLSGDARKGAEQALRDYHIKVDPWGNIEDAEEN